ncbi:MAG: hypothetical protein IJ224_08260 [Lachnospiraceae bacterium]|nr:hypothetical protein [Lachnospiraceae bacterium]
MNILYAGNYKVFDGVMTSMLSILKRTKVKEPFNFYILTMDVSFIKEEYTPITKRQIDILSQAAKKYNSDNEIKCIDVTDIYNREFAGSPNEQCYCSPYTLIRLFMDMLPDIPDKILYLDADIMFNRDIALLYNHDVSDYEYAAARDHYGKYLIYPNYINAGVLLFNMKKCRETGLFEKARELIKIKKLTFADQSAIIRSTTKKRMLPQKFNDQKFLHKSTVVRHFSKRLFYLPYPHTENVKQWHIDRMKKVFRYNQFDDILDEYLDWKEKLEDEQP